jgi:hypothetical protein
VTLEQCQDVFDALDSGVTVSLKHGRAYLSWDGHDGRESARWDAPEGSHFPTWFRTRGPWGGTRCWAYDQLVRRLLGKATEPLGSWRGVIAGPAKLAGERGPRVLDALVAAGWPEEVPCHLCGKAVTRSGDWFTTGEKGRRKSGPSCSMSDCRREAKE